ncbi:PREDICTED: patched domain-containing protein 3-like [Branchiostoma belcheri]|uniref:Patched domain-containing protein 3 n=1 Tax=Branchiostoma belcheri TaxID=7741 RepID=A0A6P4Z8W0_BRABE|nr:PREDICTED: patched domain-containing protein 3-like [Branchiostoma belcheri]
MAYDCIERRLRRLFELHGSLVARYPLPFLIIPILVAGGLASGMYLLPTQQESGVEYLFTPTNGQAKTERSVIQDRFPTNVSSNFQQSRLDVFGRFGRVILTAKDKSNILQQRMMEEVLRLHEFVLNNVSVIHEGQTYRYKDLCAAWEGVCDSNDLLELVNYNASLVQTTTIRYPTSFSPVGAPLFLGTQLGGVTFAEDTEDTVDSAEALQLHYYVRWDDGEQVNDAISAMWEEAFLTELPMFTSTDIDVAMYTSNSRENELNSVTNGIIPLFSITFSVIITFAVCSCADTDAVRAKPWLGMLGVVSAGLAIVSSMGLVLFCGVKFISIVASMPFLCLGIGIDDMFIMVAAWRKTNPHHSVERRMSEALGEAAMSITITSITDGLAFGIGAITVFPSVQIFCIFTGVALVFDYIYQITFFAACMAIFGYREKKNLHWATCLRAPTKKDAVHRSGCFRLFCAGGVSGEDLDQGGVDQGPERDHFFMRFFKKYFGPFLTNIFVKVVVIVLFLGYLAVSIWGCTQLREGLRLQSLADDNSYIVKFYDLEDEYFKVYGPQIMVSLTEEVDYSNLTVQQQISDTLEKFENSEYSYGSNGTESWLTVYKTYLQEHPFLPANPNNERFIRILKDQFLKRGWFDRYQLDIEFDENKTKILSSRFFVQSKNTNTANRERDMMLDMRRLAAEAPFQMTVFHPAFIFYDQYTAVLPNTLQNIGIATACMLVVSLLLVPHPVCSLWIVLTIASIDAGVIGFMTLWGVNLDSVSMINIIMCIGFSVDFSAHITYAFVTGQGETRNERSVFALYSIGMPIVQSAVSTILGILALAFSTSYIFRTFFKTMLLVMLFGAMHGIVVLPVVLTFLGPKKSLGIRFEKHGSTSKVDDSPYAAPTELTGPEALAANRALQSVPSHNAAISEYVNKSFQNDELQIREDANQHDNTIF